MASFFTNVRSKGELPDLKANKESIVLASKDTPHPTPISDLESPSLSRTSSTVAHHFQRDQGKTGLTNSHLSMESESTNAKARADTKQILATSPDVSLSPLQNLKKLSNAQLSQPYLPSSSEEIPPASNGVAPPSLSNLKTSRNPFRNFKLKINYFPTLRLENSGSVARDHLASERTFLAYVRTSLALASTGVAVVQLFTIANITSKDTTLPDSSKQLHKFARPIGVTTVVLALIVLGIAVYRYFLIQYSLPEKQFPVARFSVAFIAFMLGALVVVLFASLLVGRLNS